ncbi:unnamed protein product [Linum tenue]|uniref:Uncharacterized protein n=1 Tax=Linum tenue TaxID=586396 RepID=A0AAV0PKS9_9ROSI|nr:unnamed protein product [Linum tenue]
MILVPHCFSLLSGVEGSLTDGAHVRSVRSGSSNQTMTSLAQQKLGQRTKLARTCLELESIAPVQANLTNSKLSHLFSTTGQQSYFNHPVT